MKTTILVAAAAGALALPASAGAHVTVHPNKLPAGQFTVTNLRVPNERDNASTTKIQVEMPDGFASASVEPRQGWSARVAMEKAAKPIEMHGEQSTEQVATITLTAEQGQGIRAGQFIDFPLSVRVPDAADKTLTFKAIQTYSNGEVVRWIGAPDADEPAPQVAVVAADAALEDVPAGATGGGHDAAAAEEESAAAQPAASTSEDDGPSEGLVIAALILGGLGLLAGVAGLLMARRRPAAS